MKSSTANGKLSAAIKKDSRVHYAETPLTKYERDSSECSKAIGYLHSDFFTPVFDANDQKPEFTSKHYFSTSANCPQLWRALEELPSRTTTGKPYTTFFIMRYANNELKRCPSAKFPRSHQFPDIHPTSTFIPWRILRLVGQ